MKRLHWIALLFLGVLSVVLLTTTRGADPAIAANPGAQDVRAPAADAGANHVATAPRIEVEPGAVDDRALFHVLDSETGLPLEGVRALPSKGSRERSLELKSPAIPQQTGVDGAMPVPAGWVGRKLVLQRAGYAATTVTVAAGTQEVRLARAAQFEVQCVGPSGPATDCVVVVATTPVVVADGHDARTVGNPESAFPLWSGMTDETGRLTLQSVVPGTYRLCVFHPFLFPVEESAVGNVDLDVPRPTVSVTLREMQGLVAAVPTDGKVRSCVFRVDQQAMSRDAAVLIRRAFAVSSLKKKFPGSLVYCNYPKLSDRENGVEPQVLMEDGTEWTIRWILQPVSQIVEPLYLQQVKSEGVGTATIEVTSHGQQLGGIPIYVVRAADKRVIAVKSGDSLNLPAGAYTIETEFTGPWLEGEEAVSRPFELQDRAIATWSLAIEKPMVPLRIVPRFVHASYDVVVHISVSRENGESVTIANWAPDHGPVTLLVPQESIDIRASAFGYEVAEQRVDITSDMAQAEVDLTLSVPQPSHGVPPVPGRPTVAAPATLR